MKPNYLNNKSKISLVAPSFGCTISPYKERLTEAIKTFKKLNIELDLGYNIFKDLGKAASNTPKLRGIEFMKAWNSDSNALISVGGGETMVEMLEYVDFELIKKKPKWFVGFSDNTNLTYTITTICDIETIYGTNAPNFHTYPFTYDTLDTWNMLFGETKFKGYKKWQLVDDKTEPLAGYKFDMKTEIIVKNYTTPFEGRLIGGCLDCLATLCGTKYDKTKEYCEKHKNEGIIFFLECCDFNSIGLRRALTQLKYAGWFDNVSGFIIGRSNNYYDESFGISMVESYIDILSSFNVPILINIDLGHLGPSLPIRTGGLASIEYKDNNILIEYKE